QVDNIEWSLIGWDYDGDSSLGGGYESIVTSEIPFGEVDAFDGYYDKHFSIELPTVHEYRAD
ncbi:MAG: hypothetical protein EZS28_050679, partial [Streblomastix strix]